MPKKRTTKKIPTLKWKKQRGRFTYEIVDPVTNGLWMLSVGRKMSDDELFSCVHTMMTFQGVERPKSGQVLFLEMFG